mmetsp:Transcript_1918/g.5773  ORF Transcript_1918/g.5773 Transcript_1918/m.5773 type:complete len:206 (-) Transcript_1918:773-1390(-)
MSTRFHDMYKARSISNGSQILTSIHLSLNFQGNLSEVCTPMTKFFLFFSRMGFTFPKSVLIRHHEEHLGIQIIRRDEKALLERHHSAIEEGRQTLFAREEIGLITLTRLAPNVAMRIEGIRQLTTCQRRWEMPEPSHVVAAFRSRHLRCIIVLCGRLHKIALRGHLTVRWAVKISIHRWRRFVCHRVFRAQRPSISGRALCLHRL